MWLKLIFKVGGYIMKKGFPEHLEVIEYTETFVNGYKLDKVAMFNSTVVSQVEVQSWIEQGLLDIDSKPTVVVMTKKQYENLFDHYVSTADGDCLYADLALEQKETM
jgi:hypothetical protein